MMTLNLKRGITFEDSDTLLEWGRPVDELAETFRAEVENQGDRTLYNWGPHRVLNGLELNLMNSFWNFGEEQCDRVFKSIEFWAIGDRPARDNFDSISRHLTEQLGQPIEKNETADPEKTWIWRTTGALIHLHFFEQHVFKLCLTIEQDVETVALVGAGRPGGAIMAGELTSYGSLDVGKRYRVKKAFDKIAPGDTLDLVSVTYHYYGKIEPGDILDLVSVSYRQYNDCYVLAFSKPDVGADVLISVTVYEKDRKFLGNITRYFQEAGDTPKPAVDPEIAQDTTRMPEGNKKYDVLIDDNFHHGMGESPILGGSYNSYAKAVRKAKRIVDSSLAELHEKGMSADDLCRQYIFFGDDPYVVPTDGNPSFSARTYAQERYAVICEGRRPWWRRY